MASLSRARRNIEEHHYRFTPQREAICRVFLGEPTRHFAAEEIRALFSRSDGPGPATVYRTLAVLQDVGLLRRVDTGDGCARYEWAPHDATTHCHLVCIGCGAVQEIDWSHMPDLAAVLDAEDFEVTTLPSVFGHCRRCREQGSGEMRTDSA